MPYLIRVIHLDCVSILLNTVVDGDDDDGDDVVAVVAESDSSPLLIGMIRLRHEKES